MGGQSVWRDNQFGEKTSMWGQPVTGASSMGGQQYGETTTSVVWPPVRRNNRCSRKTSMGWQPLFYHHYFVWKFRPCLEQATSKLFPTEIPIGVNECSNETTDTSEHLCLFARLYLSEEYFAPKCIGWLKTFVSSFQPAQSFHGFNCVFSQALQLALKFTANLASRFRGNQT